MVILEIPDNPNCEPVDLRVFEDLDAPRRVTHVRLAPPIGSPPAGLAREPGLPRPSEADRRAQPAWYDVVGWSLVGSARPARVQKVSDSGNGTALLVYGGEAGLRLRPEGSAAPWGLDQPGQWGAPFLLMDGAEDVRIEQGTMDG